MTTISSAADEILVSSGADEIETEKKDEILQTPNDIFTILGPDFTITHIIPRLDHLTLIAFAYASPQLRCLCMEVELLWKAICTVIWPSSLDPIVTNVISTFPGGYRSFFYDVFSSIHHNTFPSSSSSNPPPPTEELISAVDLYVNQGPAVFSKVKRLLNTPQERDNSSPIVYGKNVNIRVLVPKDDLPLVKEKCKKWLKKNMRLSWIVIDPSQKRAANLSSCKPLSVLQNLWWRGVDDFDFKVVFQVMITGKKVMSRVNVWCRLRPGEVKNVLCIRKLSMEMLRTEISIILQTAILHGVRKIFHTNKRRPRGEEEEEEASTTQFNYCDYVSIAKTIGLQMLRA